MIMSGSALCEADGTTTKTPEQKMQGTYSPVTLVDQTGFNYECQNAAINGGYCNDKDFTLNSLGAYDANTSVQANALSINAASATATA